MGVRTQDLIFTLYGDYLLHRNSPAWIGSLIELLGTLDISEQAVRSTASRMARKGWLASKKWGRNSYYSLTPKSVELLSEGAQQIFHPPPHEWDGNWYLITYAFSDDLKLLRHRLRKRLSWLGFGQLANGPMISPRNRRGEVQTILDELSVHEYVSYFQAKQINFSADGSLASRCWNLQELSDHY
jgi:phenylacetic acid degradation operon negative regulatory protein